MSHRLGAGPWESIDRNRPIGFWLDGRDVLGFAGDSVASAIAAAGVVITGRSFKYHRPRGLFCMTGACANCLVRIDGVPNLRACQTQLKRDMRVERQNGIPSVDFDLARSVDRLSFFFPAGFLYNWPRTVTMVGVPTSDSSPFDNSFDANANDRFGSTCNARLPEGSFTIFPRAVISISAAVTPLSYVALRS